MAKINANIPLARFSGKGRPPNLSNLDWLIKPETTVLTPQFVYFGEDAVVEGNWPAHTYGDTLSQSVGGTGVAVAQDQCPLMGNTCVRCNYDNGWIAPDGDMFDWVLGESIIVEGFIRAPGDLTGNYGRVFDRYYSAGGNIGPNASFQLDAGSHKFLITTGQGGSSSYSDVTGIPERTWFFFTWITHWGGSTKLFVNKAQVDSMTTASPSSVGLGDAFTIGADSSNDKKTDSCIAYLAMWKGDSIVSTADLLDWHKERCDQLFGFHGRYSVNIARDYDHSCIWKTEDNGDVYFHRIGAGLPRIDRIIDENGDYKTGLRVEQDCDYVFRKAINGTSWSNESFVSWESSTEPSPIKDLPYEALRNANSDPGGQRVTSANATTATAGNYYTAMILLKPGAADWVRYYLWQPTPGLIANSYYDIANAGLGQVDHTPVARGIVDLGSLGCLIWVSDQAVNSEVLAVGMGVASGNGAAWTTVGTEILIYAQAGIVVEGIQSPASLITEFADTTSSRPSDDIYWDIDLEGEFSINAEMISSSPTTFPTGCARPVACYAVGGNSYAMLQACSSGSSSGIGRSGGVDQFAISSGIDIADGKAHNWDLLVKQDDVQLHMDGILRARDTSADLPTGLNRFGLNSATASSSLFVDQLDGLITELKLRKL